jgi:hypothetical protein
LSPLYISHVVKNFSPAISKVSGKEELFKVQIISCLNSPKKILSFEIVGGNDFYKAKNLEELKTIFQNLLNNYHPFEYKILTLDKPYEADLVRHIVNSFSDGLNIEDKINEYKINKELQ